MNTELQVGQRLPAMELHSQRADARVPLRPTGRRATVLVTVHAECAACADYVAQLVSRDDDFSDWDGRLVLVCDGSCEFENLAPSNRLAVAEDHERRVEAAGIATPAVLIADQWGELFVVEAAGTTHSFITAEEVVDWLRYLAIQCPECQAEAF